MSRSHSRGAPVLGIAIALLAAAAGPWTATAAEEGSTTTTSPPDVEVSASAGPAPETTSTTTTTPTTTTTTAATTTTTTAATTTTTTIAAASTTTTMATSTTSTTSTPTTSTTSTTPTTTTTTPDTTTTAPAVAANGVSTVKSFTVAVAGTTGAAPDAWAGDVDATLSATITNTSSSQSLGSVNLTVPAPYVLIGAPADTVPGGPVVELRDLAIAPGGSTVVQLVVTVDQCTSGSPAPFAVTAKQSNDYNGVGNDFTLAQPSDLQVDVIGTCVLSWLAGPADAERGATITSAAFDPNGAPVVVEVLDGGGVDRTTAATGTVTLAAENANVGSPTLGGTTTAAISDGLATFSPGPTLAPSAFDYVLTASSPNLVGSGPSASFDIVDKAVNCPAGGPCNGAATASSGKSSASATFGGGAQATHLTVSLDAADVPSFSCAGYPRTEELPVAQFVFTGDAGGDRVGTFTVTIVDATRPWPSYEACWAAPYSFATKSGAPAEIGATKPGTGEPLFVGLLPDCPRRDPEALPCVSDRTFDARTRAVTIVVRATGQDPWRY